MEDQGRTSSQYLHGIHRKSSPGICIGSEVITLAYNSVSSLTPPTGANYAFLMIETGTPSSFTESTRVARITFDGTNTVIGTGAPKADGTEVGLPYGHLDSFDIDGRDNLYKLRAMKSENKDVAYLKVYYYR